VDSGKIERAVRLILEAIGEDPSRRGLAETPRRVAGLYSEIFSGVGKSAASVLGKTMESGHREMVLLKNISFYSVCEHHLLPFFGKAHIAYIPDNRILGFCTIAKFVELLAKRPCTQEWLTREAADILMEKLKPKGAMVVVEARHLCMEMRGVKKTGSTAITSAVRGVFLEDERTRAEASALIKK
jgi:GTP cyclohydrolase I